MLKNDVLNKDLKKILVIFLTPLFLMLIMECFYSYINFKMMTLINSNAALLELIIIYLIFFILCGLTKKTGKSILILSIMLFLISTINQIKIAFTGEPIFLTDILYWGSSDELIGIVHGTFWDTIKQYIIPILIEFITFGILVAINLKNEIEINIKKINISLIVVPALIITILFMPLNGLNEFTLNYFFKINDRKDYYGNTTNMVYYLRYGILTGMYGQLLENRIRKPKDYNDDKLNSELKKASINHNSTKFGKPNIIVVFSESFWDIGQLEEIKFDKEVALNFNKLKNEGLFFNMISPSYGGISANVEFEFLTGANTMYFNNGYIPYMQLYTNSKYKNNPSIIQELKNNGYKTKITTYVSPRLFNCGRFYNYLNIDEKEYITNVNESEKKGQYISDKSITDKIINEFNNKEKDEKLFYMTLTMQAHMPYPISKYDNYDIDIVESNLSDKLNETLKSYAQGIYDADKELGRLYEYVKQIEEPTIIVFYGDHLPYLSNGKEDAMKELKFFNTEDKNLNNFRKYNTQSLILANFEIEQDNNIKYLGPDLLSTYIINNMDIEISDYYKWLYNTKDTISASNYLVSVNQNGELYNTNQLEGKFKEMYELRKNMQYKLFIK